MAKKSVTDWTPARQRPYNQPYLLYWAYGSNLCVEQMKRRCPDAIKIGKLHLPNAVLRFRGVADVAYLKGGTCPGGLWEVSRNDLLALDRYEGVDSGFYKRVYIKLLYGGEERSCLLYQMTTTGIMPPTQEYLDVIAEGYRDFGLNLDRLRRALEHSYWRQRITPKLTKRFQRQGFAKRAVLVDNPCFKEAAE